MKKQEKRHPRTKEDYANDNLDLIKGQLAHFAHVAHKLSEDLSLSNNNNLGDVEKQVVKASILPIIEDKQAEVRMAFLSGLHPDYIADMHFEINDLMSIVS